ncbi:MAG: phosphatase PAP2 family protein [Aquabacterium sp.]|uniref:phosphatase PAP2 family protein n=1 Tax=Aquabacterium sp. TaxID=1872578 RepID=UPI003BB18428
MTPPDRSRNAHTARTARHEPDDDDDSFDTRLIWAGLFLSLALFAKVPTIDLIFSQRYYTPQAGFFQANNPLVQALYQYTPMLGNTLLVLSALLALGAPRLARLARRQGQNHAATQLTGLWRRTAIGLLLMATLSSGLIVELGLKNFMGRPRPVQTIEFGGDQPFHGAFQRGDNPGSHRSFVSGHAAAGFSLIALGLFAGRTWRRRWTLIGLTAGALVGLGRIMQGGHYLSDVVFSFYAVWLSCELVAFGMRRWDQRRQAPPRAPTAT